MADQEEVVSAVALAALVVVTEESVGLGAKAAASGEVDVMMVAAVE